MSSSHQSPAGGWTAADVAGRIQHTLIRTGVTDDEIVKHCRECLEYGFDAAMVSAYAVPLARRALRGSGVKVAAALDFPIHQMTAAGKVAEARELASMGVDEIDLLPNIGWLRSGRPQEFVTDLQHVVEAARPAAIKVMLELPLLSGEQRLQAIDLSVAAGARWLKNASSSAIEVASPESIQWLRSHTPDGVGVKASGGIKSYAQATALFDAGADLVGSSAGVAIVTRASDGDSY